MKKASIFFLLSALITGILACGQGTGGGPTPIPSLTATPTVKSICLQVNAGDFSDEIRQTTQSLLTELGLTTVTPGAACDASLTFDLTIVPLSTYYTGLIGAGAECYTGAEATGQITYSITGYQEQSWPVDRERPPDTGVILYYCPGPTEAPFASVWRDVVFQTLNRIWGDKVYFLAAEDEDAAIREEAMWWLSSVWQYGGPDAERALTTVIHSLQADPAPSVRMDAADALAAIWPKDDRVVPALAAALSDEDALVRAVVAQNIGEMREDAAGAVPALIQALSDTDGGVRYNAAVALGDIGPGAVEAVPALIPLLADEHQGIRMSATYALREIGPGAMEAVPALIQALGDEDMNVQKTAADALEEITGQDFGEDAAQWQQWWEGHQ